MKAKTKKRKMRNNKKRDGKTLNQRFLEYGKKVGQWLLQHRKKGLAYAFLTSILLSYLIIYIYYVIICYGNEATETHLIIFRGLLYSLSPLPLFFLLWFYRHTDTQENLSKQQQNIHQNALFEAQRLILEHDNSKKSVAIAQMKALLTDVPEFKDSIYIALKAGLQAHPEWKDRDTLRVNLSDCDLRGIDLQGAILKDADLQSTNLENANLSGVDLSDANLDNADLSYAKLFDANLSNIIFYRIEKDDDGEEKKIITACFEWALCNGNTTYPDDDDPAFDHPMNECFSPYPRSVMIDPEVDTGLLKETFGLTK